MSGSIFRSAHMLLACLLHPLQRRYFALHARRTAVGDSRRSALPAELLFPYKLMTALAANKLRDSGNRAHIDALRGRALAGGSLKQSRETRFQFLEGLKHGRAFGLLRFLPGALRIPRKGFGYETRHKLAGVDIVFGERIGLREVKLQRAGDSPIVVYGDRNP